MTSPETTNDGAAQASLAGEARGMMVAPSPELQRIAELQVRRKFYISVNNKQRAAAKALARRALGQQWTDDEESRAASSARAGRIVDAAIAGRKQKTDDEAVADVIAFDLAVIAEGMAPFETARNGVELDMRKAARKLPVFGWVKDVYGLSDLGLAVIIAEAGNLSGYPKKGHLWKRLGLAPLDGKAMSTWRRSGGLTAEDWADAGYSPRRRSEVFAFADRLFMSQTKVMGPYREVYDRRRARTAELHPDWTKMHSHMDALRIMTKALIRDLWQQWRLAEAPPQ